MNTLGRTLSGGTSMRFLGRERRGKGKGRSRVFRSLWSLVVVAFVGSGCAPALEHSMREACAAAIEAGNLVGIVDNATLRALDAIGLRDGVVGFEDTPWAGPNARSATYEWEARSDEHDFNLSGDRVLYRHQHRTRIELVADEVPGGVRGFAWCWFVEDPESSEFWFWRAGDGTWLVEQAPRARVNVEYDPSLDLAPRN